MPVTRLRPLWVGCQQVDVLVVLDRSQSVWAHADQSKAYGPGTSCQHEKCQSDWVTTLEFFQRLVQSTTDVAENRINFALATFSEDFHIHFGFNAFHTYRGTYKNDVIKAAQFPQTEAALAQSDSEWVPHNFIGGLDLADGGLEFGFTNYGKVIDAINMTYGNPTYGARARAKPLIFLVTDGSMDDQDSGIYGNNACPDDANYVCGYDNRGRPGFNEAMCKACWRVHLAERLDDLRVHGKPLENITVIGIGDANATKSVPDRRTLDVFARNNPDGVIQHPAYADLERKVLPVINGAIDQTAVVCCRRCAPVSKCNPTCGDACGRPEALVSARRYGFPAMDLTCGSAFASGSCSCDESCRRNRKPGAQNCCPDFVDGSCEANAEPCCPPIVTSTSTTTKTDTTVRTSTTTTTATHTTTTTTTTTTPTTTTTATTTTTTATTTTTTITGTTSTITTTTTTTTATTTTTTTTSTTTTTMTATTTTTTTTTTITDTSTTTSASSTTTTSTSSSTTSCVRNEQVVRVCFAAGT